MTELSPAALAVMNAVVKVYPAFPDEVAAAAIRAAADQVVSPALEEEFFDRNHALPLQKMVEIRLSLLAIADELAGQ